MEKVQADEVSEQVDSATADSEVVRVTFEAWAREAVRDAFLELAEDEVERLCGKRHHPDRTLAAERAGSAPGRILFGTDAMSIQRPRVRASADAGRKAKCRYGAMRQRDAAKACVKR